LLLLPLLPLLAGTPAPSASQPPLVLGLQMVTLSKPAGTSYEPPLPPGPLPLLGLGLLLGLLLGLGPPLLVLVLLLGAGALLTAAAAAAAAVLMVTGLGSQLEAATPSSASASMLAVLSCTSMGTRPHCCLRMDSGTTVVCRLW
jgi:hypothetical protein